MDIKQNYDLNIEPLNFSGILSKDSLTKKRYKLYYLLDYTEFLLNDNKNHVFPVPNVYCVMKNKKSGLYKIFVYGNFLNFLEKKDKDIQKIRNESIYIDEKYFKDEDVLICDDIKLEKLSKEIKNCKHKLYLFKNKVNIIRFCNYELLKNKKARKSNYEALYRTLIKFNTNKDEFIK